MPRRDRLLIPSTHASAVPGNWLSTTTAPSSVTSQPIVPPRPVKKPVPLRRSENFVCGLGGFACAASGQSGSAPATSAAEDEARKVRLCIERLLADDIISPGARCSGTYNRRLCWRAQRKEPDMRSVAVAVLALLVHLQPANLPPAYPRAGVTKILDNDRVQVWNIAWLKGEPSPLHRHIYDLVGVYYEPGDRMIISPEGAKRP